MISRNNKSASNFGSELNPSDNELPNNQLLQWYSQMYKNRNNYRKAPNYLPQYKLVISKIQGITINKKSTSSELFINISGMIFTQKFQIIGTPFFYQYYQAIGRSESKWDVPVAFYFHSKIDKNYEGLYLSLKIKAIEMKGNIVQSILDLGTAIITNPLIQEENKSLPVFKELDEAQFGYSAVEIKNKTLGNNSPTSLQYSLQSSLQLKKLIRLVPQNMLFSHQNCINGIYGSYLPKQIQRMHINQAQSTQLTISFLQIHVSQKFQLDLISYIKRIYPNEKGLEIKNRKVVLGFHNTLNLVNSSSLKLEPIDKQIVGNMKISILEALKDSESIKLSYYNDNNCQAGVIAVGLIYQVGGKQIQAACYFFIPTAKGEQISDKMLTGSGYGSLYQMLPLGSNQVPTLILQYVSETKQYQILANDVGEFTSAKSPHHKKAFLDQETVQKQREKLMEEIERERLQIMKQKQELEKVKTTHHSSFQAEFERKFQVQKENLYKRQQMIQNQYKEQVERQIREKSQLQEQIRKMNDKLKTLQDTHFKKPDAEASYQNSPAADHLYATPYKQETPNQMPPLRQRLDAGYILEPENSIPAKRVRQILNQTPKINPQLLKISQEQFNLASKFTFSFISIVWESRTEPPKNIYLIIRFFNNRQFQTDTISYIQEGQQGFHQLVRLNSFIKGYQNKQPSYSFTIDPSEYHQPAILQKDLTNYLAFHNAIIDVFCGQTHLYIGQINIKLKELLRGNRTQTLIAKQLNLVKLKDKEVLGVMQILIKNEQLNCKEQISVKHQQKVKDIKKKIVSNNPIFISNQDKININQIQSENKTQPIRNKASTSNRQELRIQKFKQQKANKNFALTTNNFTQLGQPQKGAVLGQIISYKQKKMQDYIKGVYEGLLSEKITISAHYGKAVTFPFVFFNRSQSPSSYKISILSVGSDDNKELVVVKANKEWRYIVAANNYVQPKRYDMIGQKDNFFLQPGQSIPLVFKFITFESNPHRSNHEKMINVTICKEDNNWIAGGFSLIVQTHEQVIHHSYVLYEPGQQIVDLIVPVIYSDTQNNSNPKRLHLTDSNPHSTAQWLSPYQILIRTTTPKIMEKVKFNLLLYEDEYFCDLKQNWLIEIYSYQGVCASSRSDFNTKFKITLPWAAVPAHLGLLSYDKAASSLKLYSSSSGLLFKNSTIDLEEDRRNLGGYQIWCELVGSQNNKRTFQITCVSGQQNELIYGWVVTVYPYLPRTS